MLGRSASQNRFAYVEGAPETFADVLGFFRSADAFDAYMATLDGSVGKPWTLSAMEYVDEHQGDIIGGLVAVGCTVLTGGGGIVGCAILGGAISGGMNYVADTPAEDRTFGGFYSAANDRALLDGVIVVATLGLGKVVAPVVAPLFRAVAAPVRAAVVPAIRNVAQRGAAAVAVVRTATREAAASVATTVRTATRTAATSVRTAAGQARAGAANGVRAVGAGASELREQAVLRWRFRSGASHLIDADVFVARSASPVLGNPRGMFVAPTSAVDRLLASGAQRVQLERFLGLDSGQLASPHVLRISINPWQLRGLRIPDPALGNAQHIPGSGLTSGGVYEATIAPPLRGQPGVTVEEVKGLL